MSHEQNFFATDLRGFSRILRRDAPLALALRACGTAEAAVPTWFEEIPEESVPYELRSLSGSFREDAVGLHLF
jgi:hypothetical protein